MQLDATMLRRFAPLAVPAVVVVAAWGLLIRPASARGSRAAVQVETLRPRLNALQATVGEVPAAIAGGDPIVSFERQLAGGDAPALLGHLTRLAMSVGAADLVIDSTGTRVAVASRESGPRVEGASEPDPRLALFETRLAYSTIPISFDATYAAVGEFLWRFRDMPGAIEIRGLTVKPRSAADGEEPGGKARPPADGLVTASMTLFVYERQGPPAVQASSIAGAP